MGRTLLLTALMLGALSMLGPWLDGVVLEDHGDEYEQARDLEDAQRAAQARQRFERAAQQMCGSQAAWREAEHGIVQCFTKRGRPTVRVSTGFPS